jgi:hypothetical protein
MPDDQDHDERRRQRLIEELQVAAREHDPVPPSLTEAAIAAFSLRRMDAELAELLADSTSDPVPAGIRGPGTARSLSFAVGDVSIEVDVVESGALRRLVGQLLPPAPARITVRHERGSVAADADDLGRFLVDGLPPGRLSLDCHGTGDPAFHVETEWVRI